MNLNLYDSSLFQLLAIYNLHLLHKFKYIFHVSICYVLLICLTPVKKDNSKFIGSII